MYEAIQSDPNLADDLGLSHEDMIGLAHGDTPEGFTWHHNEEPGLLQLVHQDEHAHTAHTGGRELWGGGSEYR
ncbi:HNH endonuclease [Neobacillus sp. PS3-34]|uniref:HNH endonuclease n=1 Tax=Neobacillus sp. PS3-34 TaxID=3070678 RepID=UPI0027DFD44A|nr:HNH endonuclease [Neobacillus sp. PS3-34]WML50611.1 HNH endonuclease [Neobacillus sp. PS3-34]